MNNIGNEIKKIRLEKNIKAKDVYEGILSRTMYYRFENKNESISYPLLFEICQRLNINYQTLETLSSGENYQTIIHCIYSLFFNNREQLNNYSQKLIHKFNQTGYMKYKHLAIISHNLYLKYFFNRLDSEEVIEFKSYIFEVDCWHEYELYLIINGIFLFSLEEIDSIYYRLLKSFIKFNIPYDQFVILTTGIISICYSNKDYDRFQKYIQCLNHGSHFLADGTHSMFTRTITKFYSLLESYINNPSLKTRQQLQQILDFFLLVDLPHMFNIHHALLQFINKIDMT